MRRLPSLLLASLVASGASAATWRVTNPGDSGPGTLRWAIEQAVANPGSDKIKFAARMSGQVIQPLTALPTAYGPYTVIDGDIDDDGAPDVALNGRRVAGMAAGLRVQGLGCTIIGLAIGGFPNSGMIIADAYECTIRSCHLGVNLAGTKENLNTYYQLLVVRSGKNRIGGTSPGEGNVIAAGPNHDQCGIRLCDSSDNTVTGNYIGVARDGGSALGANGIGIQVDPGAGESTGNTIGGTTASKRNVFGGLGTGVEVSLAEDNLIAGNYFGLAADGDTVLPITAAGVKLDACRRNTVGGTAAGARNVFAGGAVQGVIATGSGGGNRVRGNYFGLNASGDAQRRLLRGIYISTTAGPQIIGGSTTAHGNYFCPRTPSGSTWGVWLSGGSGSVIRNNSFGIRPDGRDASEVSAAIWVEDTAVTVADNTIARADRGIEVSGASANLVAVRNRFRNCNHAVRIWDEARCCLGNLGNSNPDDDGANRFRPSNGYHIVNYTVHVVKAEGNTYGTTLRSEINAKIIDTRDYSPYGKVDFIPLMGGVVPTGESEPVVAITGATAAPTGNGGADISFALSARASITATVLNIAGRPVRALCRARACGAGANTLLWDAQSDDGLPVPNGVYLVRIEARSPDGVEATGVTTLRLAR
jgi:hypothetical protein